MKIVNLTMQQFDYFSYNHHMHSFYQTSMYGHLMSKYGYTPSYFGFVGDDGKLKGATMMLAKNVLGTYKYGYCPRGFLLDYDNKDDLKQITNKFKNYLNKKNFLFLKMDPLVINNKRDKEGNVLPNASSSDLIPYLTSIGYKYYGENKYFGTLKPRWNAILKVTGSSVTLFKNFDDKTRNKIRKAQSRGVEIFEGDREKNIKLFYSYIARKQPHNLTYYKNFAESFNKNFEIYFARLNTEKYLQNIKKLYEIEVEKLANLNSEIQAKSVTNEITEKLMNEKIESDKLVATYKKELQDASKLFEKYKTGIIIGTIGIVLDRNGVEFLIDGQNPAYGLFYPLYLLKWHIIDKYAKQGAVYFDLNAITGYFGDNNKYRGLNESKLGFGADVTEYVGEFDLIIKPTLYKWYCESPLFRSIMKPAK